MNYLELINKCLLELNYKQVGSFGELIKNDHKRIKSIINLLNKEICNFDGWNFLLRRKTLILPAQTSELENTVDGKILYVFINNEMYNYTRDIKQFFIEGKISGHKYSSLANKLLFPKFKEDKLLEIVYYTNNCVLGGDNHEKTDFEHGDDKSLVPMPYIEQLLVYGTCLRLKANPQYYKFSYWMSMYKDALANLKSKTSTTVEDVPNITLHRV